MLAVAAIAFGYAWFMGGGHGVNLAVGLFLGVMIVGPILELSGRPERSASGRESLS